MENPLLRVLKVFLSIYSHFSRLCMFKTCSVERVIYFPSVSCAVSIFHVTSMKGQFVPYIEWDISPEID